MIAFYKQSKERIEELQTLLTQTENEHRKLSLFLELAEEKSKVNAEDALAFANRACEIASQLQQDLELGKALRLKAMIYTKMHDYKSALSSAHASNEIFTQNIKAPEEHFWTLIEFGRIYLFLGDYNKAKEYYLKTLNIANQLDKTELYIRSTASLALNSYKLGNNSEAKLYVIKGLAKDDGLETDNHAHLYNVVGILYSHQEIYDEALTYYLKANKIWDKIGMFHYCGYVFNNIAILYQKQAEYNTAIEYYQKALEWFKETNNTRQTALLLNNIGENYLRMGDTDNALKCLKTSLEKSIEIKDRYQEGMALHSLAMVYMQLKKPTDYIKGFLDRAFEISNELNNQLLHKIVFDLYSKLHLSKRDIPEALEYQKKYIDVKEEMYEKDILEIQKTQEMLLKEVEYFQQENQQIRTRLEKFESMLSLTLEQINLLSKKL